MHFKFLIIIFFCFLNCYSQKQTANWYFGDNVGIKFTSIGLEVLNNSSMKTLEAATSISDKNGNLLFYTNGNTVFNRNHKVMFNGIDLGGNESTIQCLVVPFYNDSNKYFVFSLNQCSFKNKLYFSVVDMSLGGGNGIVTERKIEIIEGELHEGITIVKHCNNKDSWIIIGSSNQKNNYIYSFLIQNNQVNKSPVITRILDKSCPSYIKSNVKGNLIAWNGGKYFAAFNNTNGKIENIKSADHWDSEYYYAFEFSDNYIYNDDGYRVNLNDLTIEKYKEKSLTGLQLGLDGKIYIADRNYLSVIHNPNAVSINDINYEKNSIYLDGRSNGGSITNFAPFLFDTTPIFKYTGECVGEEINLYFEDSLGLDSAKWILDDGNLIVKGFATQFIFNEKGNHSVEFITYKNGISDTLQQCVTIYGIEKGFLGPDTTVCSHKPIRLSAQYPAIGNYLWNTGESTGSIVIDTPGEYWVEVQNNCATYTDTIVVRPNINCTTSLIQFPNIITPNNDGLNDYLSALTISNEINPQYLSYTIFNRWGKIIYKNSPITAPWDGNTNGNPAPAGTYFYSVKYLENIIKNGYVLLVR